MWTIRGGYPTGSFRARTWKSGLNSSGASPRNFLHDTRFVLAIALQAKQAPVAAGRRICGRGAEARRINGGFNH